MVTMKLEIMDIEEVDTKNMNVTVKVIYRKCEISVKKTVRKDVTFQQVKTFILNNAPLLKAKIDNRIAQREPYERHIGKEWEFEV